MQYLKTNKNKNTHTHTSSLYVLPNSPSKNKSQVRVARVLNGAVTPGTNVEVCTTFHYLHSLYIHYKEKGTTERITRT